MAAAGSNQSRFTPGKNRFPIHIITRRQSAVQYFIDNGYTPGIVPRTNPPHEKTSSFFALFAGLLTGLHPQ